MFVFWGCDLALILDYGFVCNSEHGSTDPELAVNPIANLNPNLHLQYIDFPNGK